jgi:predicted transcriptional regulator of viral defense system
MRTKDTNSKLAGLGTSTRFRLAELTRAAQGPIDVDLATKVWKLTRSEAAQALARLAASGWLSRVRRGIYLPLPIDAASTASVVEDAWVMASKLFKPCYIGGWSAAEHWELTEQMFSTVIVMSTRRPRTRTVQAGGVEFKIKSIRPKSMFGTREVWRSNIKVAASSPAKTIVDMLDDPDLGGGIRPVADMLADYRASKHFSKDDLAATCRQFESGAVFKRLGFLLERSFREEKELIGLCAQNLSKGTAKLDPRLTCPRIVTRWRLKVPENWKGGPK